jgi:hypothetical protein
MKLTETQKNLIVKAGGNQGDIEAAEAGDAEFDFAALADMISAAAERRNLSEWRTAKLRLLGNEALAAHHGEILAEIAGIDAQLAALQG